LDSDIPLFAIILVLESFQIVAFCIIAEYHCEKTVIIKYPARKHGLGLLVL